MILFDEIEKAHPDVFNILLQILEDGRLTDSQGRKVDFKNTVIIMTSNVGARMITEKRASLGFQTAGSGDQDAEKIRELVLEELKHTFRPEFLNRVDDIIVFHKLTDADIREIAGRMLNTLSQRVKGLGINLDFGEDAVTEISREGFDPVYGARPLRRAIQSKLEDRLSEEMLEGHVKSGDNVRCVFRDGKFEFEKVPAETCE